MRVDVAFRPAEEGSAPTAIVVDVIRATSPIAQALAFRYERAPCRREVVEVCAGSASSLATSPSLAPSGRPS